MRIYLVNKPSKVACKNLWELQANRLFSYFSIISKDCAYGEQERFNDLLALIISKKNEKHGIIPVKANEKETING
jgi:hypothetical protein